LSSGGEAGDDPPLRVIFPPGTRREEQLSSPHYARKYLISLPDGTIFHEYYYLAFHQSIVYEPPHFPDMGNGTSTFAGGGKRTYDAMNENNDLSDCFIVSISP